MPAALGVRGSRNPPKAAEILHPRLVLIGLDIEIVVDANSWEATREGACRPSESDPRRPVPWICSDIKKASQHLKQR